MYSDVPSNSDSDLAMEKKRRMLKKKQHQQPCDIIIEKKDIHSLKLCYRRWTYS